MSATIDTYASDRSRFLEKVTRTRFDAPGEAPMYPDGCWDFAVLKRRDGIQILRTGLTTRTVTLRHEAGDEVLAVSFRPSAFMPLLPGMRIVDEAAVLGIVNPCSFWLGDGAFEVPTFDNADVFAERLVRDGLVFSDDAVASVIEGRPKAMSDRTLQRRFLTTTGMTFKRFTMIQRAQKAVALLRMGRSAVDVAFALGFSDQAHLINSLRQIMGQTPGQIQSPLTL